MCWHGFSEVTGLAGELKGSRIDLAERALLFRIARTTDWSATVGIAISALTPEQGEDRGDHDVAIYATLLEDVIGAMLAGSSRCSDVIIDDGRYGLATLALIRKDAAGQVRVAPHASSEPSAAGLQIADVIANSFFNRAMVTERQAGWRRSSRRFWKAGRLKCGCYPTSPMPTSNSTNKSMHVIADIDSRTSARRHRSATAISMISIAGTCGLAAQKQQEAQCPAAGRKVESISRKRREQIMKVRE